MHEIEDVEIFRDLSLRKKYALGQSAHLLKLAKGDFVFLPGDKSDCVYIVAEGRIKISKISESGKELTLSYHSTSELFGELALLHDHPRRTMAVAVVRSAVWSIPKEEFLKVAGSSPAFSLRLSSIIGQRRHDLENRMESLVFRDVPARLAAQLLRLAEQYGDDNKGHVEITLKLSQLELANLIGATRETTSTALNEMKRAGVIDTSHRTIIIKDFKALQELKDCL